MASKTKIQNVIVALRAKTAGFGPSMKKAGGALSGLMSKFGGLKSMLAGAGLTGVLMSTVAAGATFEKQMSRVSTMLSEQDMSWMSKYKSGINDLAVEFGESTETLSNGLYDILSASVPPREALGLLKVATESAKGGFTDAAIAVDGITSVLNAFGKSADFAGDVSDKMAMTVKRGKLTFADLAENVGKVAPAAKAAGESMDTMFGIMSALTRQGINARNSSEQINAMLRTASKSGTTLMGLIKQFEGKKLGDILTSGIDDLAARGIAALSGNIKDLQGDIEAMANSGGSRLEAFSRQQATFAARWDKLKESVNHVSRSFGEGLMPVAEKVVAWAERLSQKINTLSERDYANLANKALLVGEVLIGLWAGAKITGGIITGISLIKELTSGYKALKAAVEVTRFGSFIRQLGTIKGLAAGVQWQFKSMRQNWRNLATGGGVAIIAAGLGLIIQQAIKAAAAMDALQNSSMNSASLHEKEKSLIEKMNNAENYEEKLRYAYRLKDVRERLVELYKQEAQAQKDALDSGKFWTTGGYEAAERTISNTQKVIELKKRQSDETENLIDQYEKLNKAAQKAEISVANVGHVAQVPELLNSQNISAQTRRQVDKLNMPAERQQPLYDDMNNAILSDILEAIRELIRVTKSKSTAIIGR